MKESCLPLCFLDSLNGVFILLFDGRQQGLIGCHMFNYLKEKLGASSWDIGTFRISYFWSVHGFMITLGLLQSYFAWDPKYSWFHEQAKNWIYCLYLHFIISIWRIIFFYNLGNKTVLLVGWFCCFTSQVNSYGHCGTVSSPNHTFFLAGLNKRLTSNLCTYFACNWQQLFLNESAEGRRMTIEIISWSITTKVWDRAGIELATPGSAVRHASVARHVTDCATRPGKQFCI